MHLHSTIYLKNGIPILDKNEIWYSVIVYFDYVFLIKECIMFPRYTIKVFNNLIEVKPPNMGLCLAHEWVKDTIRLISSERNLKIND